MPRVSAIITTFNRADFLKKAVVSVLNQAYKDFELIVLDNSSADNTEDIVRTFQDERIRYIQHRPLGISPARNLGVKESRGEFIAFLDDDDEWLPNKLESELLVFEKGDPKLALVYGGFIWVDAPGKEVKTHYPVLRGFILKDLLRQKDAFTGSASNPLLQKSVVETLGGYDERVKTGEDLELYLRLAEKYEVDFTPEVVVRIRQHAGARLGDKLLDAAELERMVLERYKKIFDAEPKLKSFYFQKIGGKLCRLGRQTEGREYIRSAIRIWPLNILAYAQFILSFLSKKTYLIFHRLYMAYKRKMIFKPFSLL